MARKTEAQIRAEVIAEIRDWAWEQKRYWETINTYEDSDYYRAEGRADAFDEVWNRMQKDDFHEE